MAIQLGSAYGKVSLDVSGLTNGVAKAKASLTGLTGMSKSIASGFNNIGNAMTVGVTLPLLAVGTASIKMASDMVETQSKVKVVFGSMSDSVMKWSQNSAKSMQLSRQEALEAASTFGNLFIAMKVGQGDAVKMSTTLVQLASDLGSMNDIDPSIVLQKLKSGIVGETEAVRDLGIDLRAVAVESKAVEMGFEKVNGQFTQGQLIAARYAIIMEQTKVAQGDVARTGGNLAGQLREMNAQWKDALTMLGTNLLPTALKLVTALNSLLEKFNQLSSAGQKAVIDLAGFLIILGPLAKAISFITTAVSTISGLMGSIGGVSISLAGVGAGISAAGAAIAAAAVPILAIVAVLVVLALAMSVVYLAWRNNWLHMRDITQTATANMKLYWSAFKAFLRGDTDEATGYLLKAWKNAMDLLEKIIGTEAMNRLRQAWTSFTSWIGSVLGNIRNFIVNVFSGTNWGQLGQAIVTGIAKGMSGALPALLTTAYNVAMAALAQIKKALGISSPSKAFMALGMYSAQGYQQGLAQAMAGDSIARSMTKPMSQFASSQQQNITMQFASGLTIQQVQGMINSNSENLLNQINRAMGVA